MYATITKVVTDSMRDCRSWSEGAATNVCQYRSQVSVAIFSIIMLFGIILTAFFYLNYAKIVLKIANPDFLFHIGLTLFGIVFATF